MQALAYLILAGGKALPPRSVLGALLLRTLAAVVDHGAVATLVHLGLI